MARSMVRCAITLLLLLPSGPALAKGEVLILAAADATVQEHRPNQPQDDRVIHTLAAGLGRGTTLGRTISYIRFNLGALPASTPFETVVVNEAKLSLMATSFGLARPERRFLVTVHSCDPIDWDETEITWRSQPCAEGAGGETSVIIGGADLPRAYEWNVARGVARALARGGERVTFTVYSVPLLNCTRDPFEGRGCQIADTDRIGFVRFASREREAYGIGAVPHLVVSHTSEPTLFMRMVEITLSMLSAFALTFGVYRTIQGLLGGKKT